MNITQFLGTDSVSREGFNAKIIETNNALDLAQKVFAAGGTATAITLTVPGMTAYGSGRHLIMLASANNTGSAATVNINSLGAKPLYRQGTTAAPNLTANKAYLIWIKSDSSCFYVDDNITPADIGAPSLVSGAVSIAQGGTGATTKAAARAALGITSGSAAPSGGDDGDIYFQTL